MTLSDFFVLLCGCVASQQRKTMTTASPLAQRRKWWMVGVFKLLWSDEWFRKRVCRRRRVPLFCHGRACSHARSAIGLAICSVRLLLYSSLEYLGSTVVSGVEFFDMHFVENVSRFRRQRTQEQNPL
jgi:hypothetical protein